MSSAVHCPPHPSRSSCLQVPDDGLGLTDQNLLFRLDWLPWGNRRLRGRFGHSDVLEYWNLLDNCHRLLNNQWLVHQLVNWLLLLHHHRHRSCLVVLDRLVLHWHRLHLGRHEHHGPRSHGEASGVHLFLSSGAAAVCLGSSSPLLCPCPCSPLQPLAVGCPADPLSAPLQHSSPRRGSPSIASESSATSVLPTQAGPGA
mmetsp:Transcript_6050/g.9648  ORF Transcript_6050/g.9648 Transcript_6050/m.9648 type:complete len:200 (+) Transcript_6050:114-713(+)